jgi:hypothetical protein
MMNDSKQEDRKERMVKATQNYEDIQRRIAPFTKKTKMTKVSTIGRWRSGSHVIPDIVLKAR